MITNFSPIDQEELPEEVKMNARKDADLNRQLYEQLKSNNRYDGDLNTFQKETMDRNALLDHKRQERDRWDQYRMELEQKKESKIGEYGKKTYKKLEEGITIDNELNRATSTVKDFDTYIIDNSDFTEYYERFKNLKNPENERAMEDSKQLHSDLFKEFGPYKDYAMDRLVRMNYNEIYEKEKQENPEYQYTPEKTMETASHFADLASNDARAELEQSFKDQNFVNVFFDDIAKEFSGQKWALEYFEAMRKRPDEDGRIEYAPEEIRAIQNLSTEVNKVVEDRISDMFLDLSQKHKKQLPRNIQEQLNEFSDIYKGRSDAESIKTGKIGWLAAMNPGLLPAAVATRSVKQEGRRESMGSEERDQALREFMSSIPMQLSKEDRQRYEEDPAFREEFDGLVKTHLFIDNGLMMDDQGLTADGIRYQAKYLKNVLAKVSPYVELPKDENKYAGLTGDPVGDAAWQKYAQTISTRDGKFVDNIPMGQNARRSMLQAQDLLNDILTKTEKGMPVGEAIAKAIKDIPDNNMVNNDWKEAFSSLGLGRKMARGESLNLAEEILASSLGMKGEMLGKEGESMAYNVATGIIEMLPYMAAFGATSVATKGITKGVLEHTAKSVVKETSKQWLKRQAPNFMKYALRSAVQSTMMPQLYVPEYARRRFELGVDPSFETGIKPYVSQERSPGKSAWDAGWITYSEIFSENMGEFIMPYVASGRRWMRTKGLEKAIGHQGAANLNRTAKDFYKTVAQTKPLRWIQQISPTMAVKGKDGAIQMANGFSQEVLGWHGTTGEYLEEFFNSRMANLFTGDLENEKLGLLGRVAYWDHEEELTTFLTVAGFGLMFGPMAMGFNNMQGQGSRMRYVDKRGNLNEIRLKPSIAKQVFSSYNEETNTFDKSVLDALLDNGHISKIDYDAISQNQKVHTDIVKQQKKVPERKKELKDIGYNEEMLDKVKLENPMQYSILTEYKDMVDAGLIDVDKNGNMVMPNSKSMSQKLTQLLPLIEELETKKGLQSDGEVIGLTPEEEVNLERYQQQAQILNQELVRVMEKQNEHMAREQKHLADMKLLEEDRDGNPVPKDTQFMVAKLGEVEDKIDAMSKKDNLTEAEQEQMKVLQERYRVIENHLGREVKQIEEALKERDKLEYLSPEQMIFIHQNVIGYLEEKKSGMSKKAQAYVDRYIKGVEELITQYKQIERQAFAEPNLDFDNENDSQLGEIKEGVDQSVKETVPSQMEEEAQDDPFGINVEDDEATQRDKRKSGSIGRLYDRAKELSEAKNRKRTAITSQYGKNFKKKISGVLKKIKSQITPDWLKEQTKNNESFKHLVNKHNNIKGIRGEIRPGQAAAVEVLLETGILDKSDVTKSGGGVLTAAEADEAIFEAVQRIQLLKTTNDITAETAKNIQNEVFELIGLASREAEAISDVNIASTSSKISDKELANRKSDYEAKIAYVEHEKKSVSDRKKMDPSRRKRELAKFNNRISALQDVLETLLAEQESRKVKRDVAEQEKLMAKEEAKAKKKDEEKSEGKKETSEKDVGGTKQEAPKEEKPKKRMLVVRKPVLTEDEEVSSMLKDIEDGIASPIAEETAEDKMSETMPSISVNALKKGIALSRQAITSGASSMEQKAVETIRLIREESARDGSFSPYAKELEQLMLSLFNGTFEAKNPYQKVLKNTFDKMSDLHSKRVQERLNKELHSTASVLTTGDQRTMEQRRNFGTVFQAIAKESGMEADEVEMEFFEMAKKGDFKKVRSKEDFINFLLELEDKQMLEDGSQFERLLVGIYEKDVSFEQFTSMRNFYENADIYRNETITFNFGSRVKNSYSLDHLNPMYSASDMVKKTMESLKRYKFQGKTKAEGLLSRLKVLKGDMNRMEKETSPESKRKVFEMELDFLEDVTGIPRKIWRDNYLLDNDKNENVVHLNVTLDNGKQDYVQVEFNSYNDFLNFSMDEGNKNIEDLKAVGIRKVLGNKRIASFNDSRAWVKGAKWSTSNSSKLLGTLKSNFVKAYGKDFQNFDAHKFLMDYFLKGDKERGVRSNVQKLGSSKRLTAESWSNGRDHQGNFFSGMVLANHLRTVLERENENPSSRIGQRMSKLGKKLEITVQRGTKGYMLDENGSNSSVSDNDSMSNEDFWLSQMVYFDQDGDTYNAIAGQFGDKDSLMYIRSPRYKYTGTKEQKERVKKLVKDFDAVVEYFGRMYGSRIMRTFSLKDNDALRKMIEEFIFNFAINTYNLNELINGNFEGDNYNGDFTDLVKRAAPVISPGYRLVDIEGGLEEKYTHLVINDPTAEGVDGTIFEIPNGIVIGSKSFMEKLHRNMGAIYNREHELGNELTSTKALHSATSVDGVRSLTKANVVSAEVFIKTFGEQWRPVIELMEPQYNEKGELIRRGADTISFDSGTKKNEHKVTDSTWSAKVKKKGKVVNLGSLSMFNKDMTLRKKINPREINRFIFERSRDDFYIQQDLRQDPKPRGNSLASQYRSNITVMSGSDQFIELMNSQIDVMMKELHNKYKGLNTPEQKKRFILELMNKGFIETQKKGEGVEETLDESYEINSIEDLKGENKYVAQRLIDGADINDPFIRGTVKKKILSYMEKNGLLMYGNRQTTQAIPDMFNQLKGYRKVRHKGKTHLLLPQIAANIPGAREPKMFGSKAEAIREINENKGIYADLLDSKGNVHEWEIEAIKDAKGNIEYMVPGELIVSSRVPGDDLHSHTMGRYTIVSIGNFTALPQQLSASSGEDYDGDQRYNQVFFRNKKGEVILDDSKEGLSNQAMLSMRESYQNPKNYDIIVNPIDTNKYDHFIEKLSSVGKDLLHVDKPYDNSELANPLTLEESRMNNMVGVMMKGIVTNLSTVFSYLNMIQPEVKSNKSLLIDLRDYKGDVVSTINLSGLAKDEYNMIKAHIGYLLNMSFDNAKDPKIEKMGFNEVTATMFVFALINDKTLGSDNFSNREQHDKAITSRIEELSILFNQPEFKYFTREARKLQSVNQFMSLSEIQEYAMERVVERFGANSNTYDLQMLLKYSTDLSTIKNVQRYTEKMPKNYEQYLMGKQSIDMLQGDRMRFYDATNFFEDGEFHILLQNAEKALDNAYETVFREDLEASSLLQYVISEIRSAIMNKEEISGAVKLNEQTIKEILSSTETLISLVANNFLESYPEVRREVFKEFDRLKQEMQDNRFLELLDIEESIKATETDYETKLNKLAVMQAIKQHDHSVKELKEIQEDFDKLPSKFKDLLYQYMLFTYQNRTMPSSGTYYRFMSTGYLNEKGKNTTELMDRWANDDYGDVSPEVIGQLILRNVETIINSRGTIKAFDVSILNDEGVKLSQDNLDSVLSMLRLEDFQKIHNAKSRKDLLMAIRKLKVTSQSLLFNIGSRLGKKSIVPSESDLYNGHDYVKAFLKNLQQFVKLEKMAYDMPSSENIWGVDTTTANEVRSGRRIATTRSFPLSYQFGENYAFAEKNAAGRIFRINGLDGFFVVEKVERLTKERVNDPKWVSEWSRKEGWTVEHFEKMLKDPTNKTVKIGNYQTTFRKLQPQELTSSQVTPMGKQVAPVLRGKMVYATPTSGKSTLMQQYDNVVDADVLIMEILDEMGLPYRENQQAEPNADLDSFGKVAAKKENKYAVAERLGERIDQLKAEGKTIFGGNWFFTTPQFLMDKVDYAILNEVEEDIVSRSKKRSQENPMKDEIQPHSAYSIKEREKNFDASGYKRTPFTKNGKQIITLGKDQYLSQVLAQMESKEQKKDEPKQKNTKDPKLKEKFFSQNGKSTTAAHVLNQIAKGDHPLSKLASHLLKKLNTNIPVFLSQVEYFELKDGAKASAIYTPSNRIMVGENASFRGLGSEPTLIHEVIHGMTIPALTVDNEATRYFNRLYEHAKNSLGKNYYALKDVKEFAAELLTNSEFIQAIQKVKPLNEKKYTNLWQEIMDSILSLFGIKPQDTLYNEAIAVLSHVVEGYNSMIDSAPDMPWGDEYASPVPNNMMTNEIREAMLTDNPELASFMVDHLSKAYPEVHFFSDRGAFQRFASRNRERYLPFDNRAIGHAFENAVFVDPAKAVQSTPVHEYAHIYWDALPEDHRVKQGLRELFPKKGLTLEERDERIIMEIGRIGVDQAMVALEESKMPRFKRLLRELWRAIKQLFGQYKVKSYEDYLEQMAKSVWEHTPYSTDKFNQNVVRNMITTDIPTDGYINKDGDVSEHHVEEDRFSGKKFISPTAILNMLAPEEFNEYMVAWSNLKKKGKLNVSLKEQEKLINQRIDDLRYAASAGTKMHELAEEIFSSELDGIPLYKELSAKYEVAMPRKDQQVHYESTVSLISQLVKLKDSLKKQYPNAKFHTEQKLVDHENGIHGVLDLVVEVEENRLIVIDFKTMDIKNMDDAGNVDKGYLSKSRGRYNAPMHFMMKNKMNDFKVQLLTYKHLAESMKFKDKDGKIQQNEVLETWIYPIFLEKNSERVTMEDNSVDNVHFVSKAKLGVPLKMKGKVQFQDKIISGIKTMAELSHGKNYDQIKEEVDKALGDKWVPFARKEAANAIFGLTKYFNKDLKDVMPQDIMKTQNISIYGMMNRLVDQMGYEYEDFYKNNNREPISFEQLLFSYIHGRNKEEAEGRMKPNLLESVSQMRGEVFYDKDGNLSFDVEETLRNFDEDGKPRVRVFFDKEESKHVFLEEIGWKGLEGNVLNKAKLEPGDLVAEAIFEKDANGKTVKSLRYGTVERMITKGKFKNVIVQFRGDKNPTTIRKISQHDGILKVMNGKAAEMREAKSIALRNLSKLSGQTLKQLPVDNQYFIPGYAYAPIETRGTHFDMEGILTGKRNPGEERMIDRSILVMRQLMNKIENIEAFEEMLTPPAELDDKGKKKSDEQMVKEAQQKAKQLTDMYRQISSLHSDVAGNFMEIIAQALDAISRSEALRKEHRYGVKAFPRQADQLFQMMTNTDEQLYKRRFNKDKPLQGSFTSPRELEEQFVPLNSMVSSIENAFNNSQMEMATFSYYLKEHMSNLDDSYIFVVGKMASGKQYFKRPEEINGDMQPQAKKFAEWIYSTYDKYGMLATEDALIPVPNRFALKREIAGILSGRKGLWWTSIFTPYSRRVHNALSPAAWDNEMVDFTTEDGVTRKIPLYDVKRHYADQLRSKKELKRIYGSATQHLIAYLKRRPVMGSEMGRLNEQARLQYDNRNQGKSRVYRLSSHSGPTSAMQTAHIFEALEASGRMMISNFHFEKVIPGIHMMLDKYGEEFKDNQNRGEPNDKMWRWLKDYTNITVFGELPAGESKKFHRNTIDTFNRLNSLRAMSFNYMTQAKNLAVGLMDNAIWNGSEFSTGMQRFFKNRHKAIAIMKNTGMVNIVSDAMMDDLSKSMAKFYRGAYWLMDKVETIIQVTLYTGMMTDAQFDAYDGNGNVIPGREADAMNDVEVSMIKERVSQIHGDYSKIYAAPYYYTFWGKMIFQFRKWMTSKIKLMGKRYIMDKNNMVQVGAVSAAWNYLARVQLQYNRLSEQERDALYDKFHKEFEERSVEYQKNYGKMKSTTFTDNREYFMMQVLQKERGDKIKFADLAHYEKKGILGLVRMIAAMLGTMLVMFPWDQDDEDDMIDSRGRNILEWFTELIQNDVLMFINPFGLLQNVRGMETVGPSLGFLVDFIQLSGEMQEYIQSLIDPKSVPQAFASRDTYYHRKGQRTFPMNGLRLLPGGALIRNLIHHQRLLFEPEEMRLLRKMHIFETVRALEKERYDRLMDKEMMREISNQRYTSRMQEMRAMEEYLDGLSDKEIERIMKMIKEELPYLKKSERERMYYNYTAREYE